MTRDDEFLIYDNKRHRYYLNPECLDGHPYRDEVELVKNLKSQSKNLYTWIYSQIHKLSRSYVEYVLAVASEYREALREALLACYEADTKSGYLDVKNYPGNVESGSFVPEEELKNKLVPIDAKIAIQSVGDPNIFYIGVPPVLPSDRYERYNY